MKLSPTSKKNIPTPTRTFPNTPAGTKAAFEHGQNYGEKQVIVGKGINTGEKWPTRKR